MSSGRSQAIHLPSLAAWRSPCSPPADIYQGVLPELELLCSCSAEAALGCSCGWPTGEEWSNPPPLSEAEVRLYEEVYCGTVLESEALDVPLEDGLYTLATRVTLSVEKIWRGQTSAEKTLYLSGGCAFPFEVGSPYLVFSERLSKKERKFLSLPRRTLTASQCSRTTGRKEHCPSSSRVFDLRRS